MKVDLYENYTTTSVLFNVDEAKFTQNSIIYFKHHILPHFPENKEIKILEIGCGYGRYNKAITDLGYQNIVGIDISQEQVTYAREKMGLKNVFLADASEFLDQDKKYDVILLMDVLEHLEIAYAVTLLKKIHRSLHEGGKFIIHVPNSFAPLRPSFNGDITHIRSFSADSMSQLLRMAGFTKTTHYALNPIAKNASSLLRSLLWRYFLSPAIKAFLLIANGSASGGIYTSNLLTVTTK
ncbi:class I SAM-dependent methyltransferase [Pontibacter beigongshangensis]|uniref:class I SAM-dependent methyltransferase n=1 Tax=Pontibacter beigongshangensis TaxID=2574733 RepID=UPI00164F863D|nr:class I SAM-dependent methyltransferase [Pontibacter beigongshangensis]